MIRMEKQKKKTPLKEKKATDLRFGLNIAGPPPRVGRIGRSARSGTAGAGGASGGPLLLGR